MAIGANSYGDTGEIASLCLPYADGTTKLFTTTTTPTLAMVESFTDQVSAIINVILSRLKVTIPVTQATVKLMLDAFTNDEVAGIVLGINGSGRFGPTRKDGSSRLQIITEDVQGFLETNVSGIAALGASVASIKLGYMATDKSGSTVTPLFQVEDDGYKPVDWDPS